MVAKKTNIVTQSVKFRNVTEKESAKKGKGGIFSKQGCANSNQAHLGLPGCSNRRRCLLTKGLDVTSLKELGRLMGPLQRQVFRKAYGKILDLTIAEVFTEAVVSLTQYYEQPFRCFMFEDFQIVPTVEQFEEILGCPLGGRKSYLFSRFLPSLSKIVAVVGDSARELDRIKQTQNGVVGPPRKYLEGKARDMANQDEWVPFEDVLALLIFGVFLFPNMDDLVDLAAIDAFLAYYHSKESPVVAILANLFDTFDRRCEKNSAWIVCCLPALCVWLVSHLFQEDIRGQYLAGIRGRTINWFPRWKEGNEGVHFSCGGYPNIPLIGTRGCINYNPALVIRQLGYPMRGAPTEESLSPFLVRDFGAQSFNIVQRVHKVWESPLRKDKELRGIRNGIIGGYHEWLKVHTRGMVLKEELAACSRSKKSLAQHLEATEQNMLAIIGQYKEELNQSLTHEQKLVEGFAQAYAEKEARGRWYNSNATCAYHSGAPGHNIDSCLAFKYKVQHLINAGWLSFQEEGPNVKTNPLASHGGASVNAIEKDRSPGSKRLENVATSRRVIYLSLQAACMVSRGGDKSDECLFHLEESHDMETCPTVEALLQRLMDWGQLEVSEGGREEPQICTQSAERKAPPTPIALVICFTRNVTGSRSEYPPTVPKPTPFSYQSNKVVPWKYTPPAFGEGAATEVDSLSAKVTNITGLSGVTRSGRVFAPPHSVELPSKGKAPMIQESAGTATPSKEVDPLVVKGAEKKEGLQGKAVTLEEAHEFLRLIQQSEFKVVEQLNKTPARISLFELLINSKPHHALLVKVLNEAHPRMGLGKDNHENADVVDIRGNLYKYGLGYEPGKPGRRNAPSRLRADRAWAGHVSQCFTSARIMFEEEVAAIGEEAPQDPPSFVRPYHPNFQVGNWHVMSQSEVSDLLDNSEPSSRVFLFDNILLLVVPTAAICSSKRMIPLETIKRDMTTLGIITKSPFIKVKSLGITSLKELGQLMGQLQRQDFRKAYGKIWDLAMAEVSTEAIACLAQYYDQPLRCFTFGDFQLSPMVEEFEEILGCPLGGRKPYLFSGFYPSLARISKIKASRKWGGWSTKKMFGGKSRILASRGEWASFIDILALLIFGGFHFPNVDGVVDLAAIDAFLAFHDRKESPVVAILADLYDSSTRIVCCTPGLYVWLVSHFFRQEVRHACPLESHRSWTEKREASWDRLLANKEGAFVNWFPRWKEGRTGVLISCGGFPNVPLMGTRGCISYNPVHAIRQLGYPMRGAPLEEELAPIIARGFNNTNMEAIQKVHKAWEMVQKKDKELRGSNNGPIGGYHRWLKAHMQGLDWLPSLRTTKGVEVEAPEEDEEYAQHHPRFSARVEDSSNSTPVQARASVPIQMETPQATASTLTHPAGNAHFGAGSNTISNFPSRAIFTPIPMTYEDLLPSLIAN
ncbi:hypothetical protein HKD37_18G050754 [Glycine soja]